MGIRAEQKEARRNSIISAALDLFITKGFGATTTMDIAKKANITHSLLFHYYESKEALYESLVDIGIQGAGMAMEIKTQNPMQFFAMVVQGTLEAMEKSDFNAKIFLLMSKAMREEAPEAIRNKASAVNNIRLCVPLIEEGQRLGQIRQGDSASLSFVFWAALQGVAENSLLFPDIPLPKPEWLMDILLP